MKKLFVLLVFTLLSTAFAQDSFTTSFSKALTPEFAAWIVTCGVIGGIISYLVRRAVAIVLVRKNILSKFLLVGEGERVVVFSFITSLIFALFLLQPGLIQDAKALEILPFWQTLIAITFVGVLGSSGNHDLAAQIKNKQDDAVKNSENKVEVIND